MAGKHVSWSNWDHFLGKVEDSNLANQIGCAVSTVVRRRKLYSIRSVVHWMWNKEDYALFQSGSMQCLKCLEVKPLTEMVKGKTQTNGFKRICRICHYKLQQKRLINYKSKWFVDLGGMCQCCSFDKYFTALHFHHINPEEKEFTPTQLIYGKQADNKTIHEELDKCCLLCANCHDAAHTEELVIQFQKSDFGWSVISVINNSRISEVDSLVFSNTKKRSSEQEKILFASGFIQCRRCEEIKHVDSFGKNKDAINGHRNFCRRCHSEQALKQRRFIKREWLDKFGLKCQCCNYNKFLSPLQFHHVNPKEKEFTPSNLMYSHKQNIDKMNSEIDKCSVLCSVCHDAFHSGELKIKFEKLPFGWTVASSEDGFIRLPNLMPD